MIIKCHTLFKRQYVVMSEDPDQTELMFRLVRILAVTRVEVLLNSDQVSKRRLLQANTYLHVAATVYITVDHFWPTSNTAFKWRFAGGPIVAINNMLSGWLLFSNFIRLFNSFTAFLLLFPIFLVFYFLFIFSRFSSPSSLVFFFWIISSEVSSLWRVSAFRLVTLGAASLSFMPKIEPISEYQFHVYCISLG